MCIAVLPTNIMQHVTDIKNNAIRDEEKLYISICVYYYFIL